MSLPFVVITRLLAGAIVFVASNGRIIEATVQNSHRSVVYHDIRENCPPREEKKTRRLGRVGDSRRHSVTMCQTIGPNVYQTVRTTRLGRMVRKIRGTATDGPCGDCATLCRHQVCKDDYEVSLSDDGLDLCTCTLESQPKKDLCTGIHTTCADDVCGCEDTYYGVPEDPDIGCRLRHCGGCDPERTLCSRFDGCSCRGGYEGDPYVECR